MWCPDCRDVEELVESTFGPENGPDGTIVYVGARAEWKTPMNRFRQAPLGINNIPTIVYYRERQEIGRLVEEEIGEKGLAQFVTESR